MADGAGKPARTSSPPLPIPSPSWVASAPELCRAESFFSSAASFAATTASCLRIRKCLLGRQTCFRLGGLRGFGGIEHGQRLGRLRMRLGEPAVDRVQLLLILASDHCRLSERPRCDETPWTLVGRRQRKVQQVAEFPALFEATKAARTLNR